MRNSTSGLQYAFKAWFSNGDCIDDFYFAGNYRTAFDYAYTRCTQVENSDKCKLIVLRVFQSDFCIYELHF